MSFVHPWLLLGALAGLIPLLVHLFDRRRPRPVPFAAIAFVLRSQRRTASRLKLKRLLLYTLRTLLLLAIPVALARPELRQKRLPGMAMRGAAATAIVIDASFGMRYSDGKSLFERARDEARDALRGLAAEEPATVLVCGPNAAPPPAPSFDRAHWRSVIDDAQPGYAPADLSRCLELAAHALEESPVAAKRLVVISAFFSSSFHLELSAPTVTGPDQKLVRPEIVLRDVAHGRAVLANHAIEDVKIDPAPAAGPHAFQLAVTVHDYADRPVKDLTASLQTGGQTVAKAFLDLPAQGAARKTITHRFDQSGTTRAVVALALDNLPDDDRREVVFEVPKELRALVLNGEPNAQRYRDEAFFVDAALAAPGSPVRETVEDAEAGLHESFSDYDVLLLLNVTAPNEEECRRLKEFVEQGGGLLIAAGDHVDPDLYNARLGDLLPLRIRTVRTAVAPADPDAERRAMRLKDIASDHPLFSPFQGRAREGLMSSLFFRYLLLESASPAAQPTPQILATYEDGAPALALARRGKGRVLFFTSTLDHDWTDFPIRTAFLPFVQRSAGLLAGALEQREIAQARVGQVVRLPWSGAEKVASLRSAAGTEVPFKLAERGLDAGPIPEPGVYQAYDTRGQPLPSLAFAATIDPAASDLTRLKPDELAGYFGEDTVRSAAAAGEHRVPIWTWLIVAAVCAFFLEGVLLRS